MNNTDAVLDKMKKLGLEHTRENYLDLAYMGAPPEHLDVETEAELPEEFQSQKEKEENNGE